MMKRFGALIILGLCFCFVPVTVSAVEFQVPGTNTSLNVGGYVKLDVIYNDVSAGDDSQLNVEYVPWGVPVNDTSGEENELVFNGRESRLWVKTSTPTDLGPLKSHLEFDFDTGEGNQKVSNSRGARLRHAYLTLDKWMMGQTWSLFMHLDSLPEINDFGGPAGAAFVRQALVRYTMALNDTNTIAIGIENPETTINTSNGSVDANTPVDDGIIPDIIARYTMTPSFGNLSAALMLRQLVVDNGTTDDSAFAIAAQVGGVYKITANDSVRGQVSLGEGIGRYTGLATHVDAEADGNDIDALQAIAGFVGYEHIFGGTYNWRCNAIVGMSKADDPSGLKGTTLTEDTLSVHLNVFMDPVAGARLGLEYIHAKRENYNGDDGDLNRVQFSARYVF